MGEYGLIKVNVYLYLLEGLTLSLVYGHGPCQVQWKFLTAKDKYQINVRWHKNQSCNQHLLVFVTAKENLCITHCGNS